MDYRQRNHKSLAINHLEFTQKGYRQNSVKTASNFEDNLTLVRVIEQKLCAFALQTIERHPHALLERPCCIA